MNFYEYNFYVQMKEYLTTEYVNDEYYNSLFRTFKDEDEKKQFDNYEQSVLEHIGNSFYFLSHTQEFLNKNNLNTIDYTNMIEYLVEEYKEEHIISINMPKVITLTLTYIFIENEKVFYEKYLKEVEQYENMLKEFV